METKKLCQKSITANLLPELDKYVRQIAKRRKVSMNQIINEAVALHKEGGRHVKQ